MTQSEYINQNIKENYLKVTFWMTGHNWGYLTRPGCRPLLVVVLKLMRKFMVKTIMEELYWYDSAIKPRICKVLEKNFWGCSIIEWVILNPKHRTSGCHVIGSRDNHVSKFEVPKNVGLSFSKLGYGRKFWSKNMKSA